jgi:multidrug efflux pump subunit AcrA (membrane-fusion protein)
MLVVPNRILGNDQQGDYVLVLGPDDIVARRSVVKGVLNGSDCAIASGLTAEDRVIVNGIANARLGFKATPQTDTTDSSPAP